MSLDVRIKKSFGDYTLDVAFAGGDETLGFLGASGCGKSLTLRCIAGIETPDEGRIVVNGKVFFDSEQKINLTPQREVGFDAIAERIYRFDEVRTVYLMSGSFDLLVIIEGKSLKDVANFVATRLATIEGVTQTRSHFMLKPYKKDGVIINDEERDRRLVVTP